MSDKHEVIVAAIDAAPDGDTAAPSAVQSSSLRAGGRSRHAWLGRRSGYCAETAWVWQRARLIIAKPE